MPNWCDCSYTILGEKKHVKKIYDTIKGLEKRKKPYIENGFGNLWLGCLVNKLGGDYNQYYTRGEILDYNYRPKEGTLFLYVEHAWSECSDLRKFLKEIYPELVIYYEAEEPGCEYYVTNDKEGIYYDARYYLFTSEQSEYFPTMEALIEYVNEVWKVQCTTEEEVESFFNDYTQEHLDFCYSINKFEIVND